jgi:hypothetical protein
MGDVRGGVLITLGYVVAGGLMAWEIGLDWDSPLVGVPATTAFGVVGVTVLYGFIRPFFYHKKTPVDLDIAFFPDEQGAGAVRLSYTFHF